MGDLLTRLYNYTQYKIFKATEDPAVTAFAQQQKAAAAAATAAATAAKEKEAQQTEASTKAKQQKAKPSFLRQVVSYTIGAFLIFLFLLFAIYTGHLAANDAIGRPIEYRILFFIYGAIFSVFVFPYYLIQKFRGQDVKSYALLPIREGDVPYGLEGFLWSLVSFIPDENYAAARRSYEHALRIAS